MLLLFRKLFEVSMIRRNVSKILQSFVLRSSKENFGETKSVIVRCKIREKCQWQFKYLTEKLIPVIAQSFALISLIRGGSEKKNGIIREFVPNGRLPPPFGTLIRKNRVYFTF